MKFIISIVNKDDALPLVDVLVTSGYRITTFKTTGGFLRKENVTFFTGVKDEQVEDIIRLIQDNCHTRVQSVGSLPPVMESGESYILGTEEVEVGGAVTFVLDVAQFLKA
ncbi:MAG: cyclic-di-AMP receptor [Chloroflexota bacterium]|nr:cyclic-di-AMP receptor [Chloroflexota bacterium]